MIKEPLNKSVMSLRWYGAPGLLALLLAIATAATPPPAGAQQGEVLDRVIAIVDEGVILESELENRIQEIRNQASQSDQQQLPPRDQLRDQVLESLIMQRLQLQMAERAGIQFGDDAINSVLSDLASSNNMSLDEYVSALERAGQYEATREQVRREMRINEVQRGMVNRRINITEQEIENYLNSEMGRQAMSAEYRVNQLVIPIQSSDNAATIERKSEFARQLYERTQNGESFDTVLEQARNNEYGFAVERNELGWRETSGLPTLFAEFVPDMERGAIHEPVRSSAGFHILQLADVRGDANRVVEQVNLRHILISPSEIRTERQARRLAQDLYERIQDGAEFGAMARQYSDDNMSVVAGGDMGWTSLGGLPPTFRQRVQNLEVGEMSEPFQTEQGWHLARVTDRRQRDMSEQYRRQMAENAIRERKFQVERENWMSELRDQAYVEILLDENQ